MAPDFMLWLAFGWIALLIAVSLLFRLTRGLGVFARPLPEAVFVERWRSGRTGLGLFAGLPAGFGRANNCLMFSVNRERLRVEPHFPVTLMFLPELIGLPLDVPLSQVRDATLIEGRFSRRVRIRYRHAGGDRTADLEPADPQALLRALGHAPAG
jgi:hypothetical protein